MAGMYWESPDGHINKQIIHPGSWGLKPTENCECSIKVINSSIPEHTALSLVTIGNINSNFDNLLNQCLLTMFIGEVADFTLSFAEQTCTLTLELLDFKSNGLIYEWNAKQKFDLALQHKEHGNELFNQSLIVDASRRFGKGLKLLCSIPLEVDMPPVEVDGVQVEAIKDLKTQLYNNLASCYLKNCDYETVVKLCAKVLENDYKNVKALYKQAVAQCDIHDYEESQKSLLQLLRYDPSNKAASQKLEFVNVKVAEGNAKVNAMIKKMFER